MTHANDRRPELWLVRHGETDWSATGRHTGRSDVPLNDRGREVAASLVPRLAGIGFDRVLTSPLARARDTCALAGFAGRAEVSADLAEWDYGQDEGLTTTEIRRDRPSWTVWTAGPKGGETADEVAARADRVVAMARSGQGRVLAFSHGHFSRVLASRWIGQPAAHGAYLRFDTAAVSVLGWERDTPVLLLWNDAGRLPG